VKSACPSRAGTLLLSLWLFAPSSRASAAPAIDLDTPRPYGYAIGDIFRHVVTVQAEVGYRLDESALPKPGPVNRWLELRRVTVEPGQGVRHRLILEYQTFYAPLEVKPLKVPGFSLRFEGPGGAVSAKVPAWPFSMAPIHGLSVLAGGGLEPLRPDALPEAPSTALPLARFGWFTLSGLVALLYLGHLRGLFDFSRRGKHFREANLALRRLRPRGEGSDVLREGFACVHRAFDRTLGEPLFAERLPEFIAGRSGYEGLRQEIEGFFRASYSLFFGDGDAAEGFTLNRLDALCLACLRAERGRA
jgi:mxaA protein